MSERMIENIKEAILPLVASKDCYLDDIVFEKENNEWYLRIFVEKNEGSLDMDTCVEVTDLVSAKLDEIDPIDQEYYLEISSPGLERPLKTFEAVQKNVGEYVFMELKNPQNGMSELYGTILSIDNHVLNMDYMVKNIHKKVAVDYENIKFIRMAVKF